MTTPQPGLRGVVACVHDDVRNGAERDAPPNDRVIVDANAGIVVFHPDEAQLTRLVARVAPETREVAVFANSPVSAELEARLRDASGTTALAVLRPEDNVGLGRAYNDLVSRAVSQGLQHLFLLDQDSLPEPGSLARLAETRRILRAGGERPAIVGPRPYGPDGRPMRIARLAGQTARPIDAAATPVQFVISSGSLIGLEEAGAIGPFRPDYFIDAIDLEWCFRANALGFSIWIADDIRMDHSLGRGVIRLPGGLLLADQPPRRLYTFIRNQLSMLRLPHIPVRHRAKTVLSLPVRILVYLARNRFSRETRAAIRNGVLDGIRNRLGPPDRAFAPWRGTRVSAKSSGIAS
ncbi:rhamnosyl transferase [uncultured Enterovirga sp.]|uniref:rhamnosyl transferase n=1 Tax=uncultured Enterovirga sp. TaxID=2026352 RepID=UPI0035C9F355